MIVSRILDIKVRKEKLQSINRTLLPPKKGVIVPEQLKNYKMWTAKVNYGIGRVLFNEKNVWRICFSKEVSKYGKGNVSEGIIV